jgi:adenylate cyclase
VVTTAATVELLSARWRGAVRQIDIATLKGQGTEVTLYEVLWATEDVTSMIPSIPMGSSSERSVRLKLRVGDQETYLKEGQPPVTIGRAEDNGLVVKGNLISRLHARIEMSRKKFLLVDQSTNGTFVRLEGNEEAFVRRDSVQLKGQGMIGLGKLPEADSPQTIRFTCEEI